MSLITIDAGLQWLECPSSKFSNLQQCQCWLEGTKRLKYLEENLKVRDVVLTAAEIRQLSNVIPRDKVRFTEVSSSPDQLACFACCNAQVTCCCAAPSFEILTLTSLQHETQLYILNSTWTAETRYKGCSAWIICHLPLWTRILRPRLKY